MIRVLTVAWFLTLGCTLVPVKGLAAEADSHRDAIRELVKVMNLEQQIDQSSHLMIDTQVQANPQLAAYQDVLVEWLDTYLVWEALEKDVLQIYMTAFTESEARELIVFYKSPIGQKTLAKMPVLMQQGSAVGIEVARKHQPELKQMVAQRSAELKAAAEAEAAAEAAQAPQ